jgi:hypothetical protein
MLRNAGISAREKMPFPPEWEQILNFNHSLASGDEAKGGKTGNHVNQ